MGKTPYYVIKDTREKLGYKFSEYENCKGTIAQKLDTGDYTIEGLENKICIERKASIEELAGNLGSNKDRFVREIERMTKYEHRYIILEFSIEDLLNYPDNSRMPDEKKAVSRVAGKYMLKCLMEFQVNYGVHVIFCGNKNYAFYFVASLLKRFSEKYL
jgi:ERCC4-type nuclease